MNATTQAVERCITLHNLGEEHGLDSDKAKELRDAMTSLARQNLLSALRIYLGCFTEPEDFIPAVATLATQVDNE